MYGRHIVVIAGIEGTEGTRIETLPFNLGTDQSSLHVEFLTTAATDGQPAKLTLGIFNPPRAMVSDLMRAEGRGFVSVAAGYVDQADQVLFAGKPVPTGVRLSKEGGDVLLSVEALSGGTRYRDAAVAVGRAGRVSVRRLIQDVAEEAGWTVSRNDIPESVVYPRGYSVAGSASRAIDTIARYAGVSVIYPGGDRIEFVNTVVPDVPAGFERAWQFSTERGNLISVPTRDDDGRWVFDGLISPGLELGKQVVLRCPDLLTGLTQNIRLQIQELSYKGSNFRQEFYVHVTGRRVG